MPDALDTITVSTNPMGVSLEHLWEVVIEIYRQANIHGVDTDDATLNHFIDAIGEFNMSLPKSSPFKRGRADVTARGSGQFIGLKDGESITFAPLLGLDGMIYADMHEYWEIRPAIFHPCIKHDCPGCATGNQPRFKGYIPVYQPDGSTGIFPFTIKTYKKLLALENEVDGKSLQGHVIKISRSGSGMATDYSVLGTGRRLDVSKVEVPDFIYSLGPTTADDIVDLLKENGIEVPGHTGEGVIAGHPHVAAVPAAEPDGSLDDDDDDIAGWGDI